MVPMNAFLLASPLFAGIMFDLQGSYMIPFLVVAVVSFIGSYMGPVGPVMVLIMAAVIIIPYVGRTTR